MVKHKGLGRGLDALIGEEPDFLNEDDKNLNPTENIVSTHMIRANRFQPRSYFHKEEMEELIASVREHGILQPLVVRPEEGGYELIAGERRWRAAQEAGLKKVPCIIHNLSDQEALECAMVENLQREDLNILEEAEGYQQLSEKFKLTQEEISKRVGKGRATIANALRILSLSDHCKELISKGDISAGHAKALLGLNIPAEQNVIATRIAREKLSVRETEKLVSKSKEPSKKRRVAQSDLPLDYLRDLTDQLHQILGTAVQISPSRTMVNGKKIGGKIEIDFYSADDLDRVLNILGVSN